MTSKQRIRASIEHRAPDRVPVDFGSAAVTGIHCSVVEDLRRHFGLEERPVKVHEPYQMLGLIEDDLRDALGIDTVPIPPYKTLFGFPNENWKEFRTWWGQTILVSEHFVTEARADGLYIFPEGDRSAPPSGHMPSTGYFFDTIIRQEPIDEDNLDLAANLEEFGALANAELAHWRNHAEHLRGADKAVVAHLPGTALGDIALVPAPFLKHPRGVRDITQWYMLLAEDPAFVGELFDRQAEIALGCLQQLHGAIGDVLDIAVVCGTDFGTQESTFCSVEAFREIWLPRYQRITNWIRTHTNWKTFKHSCGAVETLVPSFIEAGFDCLNPVQCSARGMDAAHLKQTYGERLCFWGGGVNTQRTLPFGTPEEVRARCEVLAPGGGFVFNSIHNVQALTPTENLLAMFAAVREFNGQPALA